MKIFYAALLFSLIGSTIVLPQSLTVDVDGHKYQELKSLHFILYYDRGVSLGYPQKVQDKAERLYSQITEEFNFVRDNIWSWDNRARIFIAADKDNYVDRFGCVAWSAACVDYRKKTIYTYDGQDDFGRVMAHEMTHVILREYLSGKFFPTWFDEGLAQYIQEKFASGYSTSAGMIEHVRRAIGQNSYIPFKEMFSLTTAELATKDQDYAQMFYAQSFSVIDFMIKKYGRDSFSYCLFHMRNGAGFTEAILKISMQISSLDDLEEKWKAYYQQ